MSFGNSELMFSSECIIFHNMNCIIFSESTSKLFSSNNLHFLFWKATTLPVFGLHHHVLLNCFFKNPQSN